MKSAPNIRRRQLGLAAAVLALDSVGGWGRAAAGATRVARIAQGVRSTEHSLAWIAEQAGILERLGLRAEVALADPHLAYAGIAQVAQRVLEGDDPVIVATPLPPNKAGFLMTAARIRAPQELAGTRVGVLGAAGPTAAAAGAVLERFKLSVELVALASFEAIYAALAGGRIEAGWLPVDLSFKGRAAHGWNGYEGVRLALPGGYVTTRRVIASERALVESLVQGLVGAVHFFKTETHAAVDLLQRFLGTERAVAAELQAFYAPILRQAPAPSVFYGIPALRDSLRARYPAAERLQATDLIDASFVDALVREGYVARLYSGAR